MGSGWSGNDAGSCGLARETPRSAKRIIQTGIRPEWTVVCGDLSGPQPLNLTQGHCPLSKTDRRH